MGWDWVDFFLVVQVRWIGMMFLLVVYSKWDVALFFGLVCRVAGAWYGFPRLFFVRFCFGVVVFFVLFVAWFLCFLGLFWVFGLFLGMLMVV